MSVFPAVSEEAIQKLRTILDDYAKKLDKLFEGLNEMEIAWILAHYLKIYKKKETKKEKKDESSHQH